MLSNLLTFVPVITLLCLVPGANNLLVWRTAAELGTGPAVATALGASTGIVSWSAGTALGLGGLVASMPGGLRTVALVGSVTMVGTGVWALYPRSRAQDQTQDQGGSRGFTTGLAVCIANPRTPLLAVSLLPQYAVGGAAATSIVLLGTVWAMVALLWNVLCVLATRGRLTAGRGRAVQVAGGVLVAGLGALGVAQAL